MLGSERLRRSGRDGIVTDSAPKKLLNTETCAMKIAIASSGLGHVARGIETWALDTAQALAERAVNVTLFAGADGGKGVRVQGSGEPERPDAPAEGHGLHVVVLNCLKRNTPKAQRLAARFPGCAWRWGLKSDYGWEQFSFWWKLWPHLRKEGFDILHVQDPMLAYWCRKFRKMGLLRTKEILAHGTEEPGGFIRQFEYVQHLAPWHLEQLKEDGRKKARKTQEGEGQSEAGGVASRSRGFVIPNFVDTEIFRPARDAQERAEYRNRLGIPKDAFAAVAVGALKRDHKRVDWLIREFADFARKTKDEVRLLQVGASTADTPALVAEAREKAGDRIVVLTDLPHDRMPELLAAADVFVHGALFEMMPIAFLEAAASGLPIVSHGHPVMQWMAGEGRVDVDMTKSGTLAGALDELIANPGKRAELGQKARERAIRMFTKRIVVNQGIAMYEAVMA